MSVARDARTTNRLRLRQRRSEAVALPLQTALGTRVFIVILHNSKCRRGRRHGQSPVRTPVRPAAAQLGPHAR